MDAVPTNTAQKGLGFRELGLGFRVRVRVRIRVTVTVRVSD